MDPVEKTPSEQLKEDVKLSKRRNGTIVDLYSGEWVSKAKVGTVKVYIKTDPDLQLMIGDSYVVKKPTPAMEALLEHWRETSCVPEVMRVTSRSIPVSYQLSYTCPPFNFNFLRP